MGVGAGLYMHDVVVKKFTFAISSPDEFLYVQPAFFLLVLIPLVQFCCYIVYIAIV